MIPAFPNAMPVEGFIGGLLIGLAAAVMLLGLGRIAGVSGLAARATGIADTGAPRNVAMAFILGLPLGAFLMARAIGEVQVSFPDSIWSLIVTYLRQAEDTLMKYEADAMINGLGFDRHEEAMAVEAFTRAIAIAAKAFVENPLGNPLIPNWDRVSAAIPDIFEMLKLAVDEDNK